MIVPIAVLYLTSAQRPKSALPALSASGRVTTVDGRGVAGAEIRVEGTNDRGGIQTFALKSGPDGRYSGRILPGIYRVRAWVPRTYNDVFGYWLGTEPKTGEWNDEFDTHKGSIARDFVWKISGTKKGLDPKETRNHWGGWGGVMVGAERYEERELFPKFPKQADVILTFTPTQKTIDGSAGKPVRFEFKDAVSAAAMKEAETWGRADAGFYKDVPIGEYTVRAEFRLPDGSTVPANLAAHVDLGDRTEVRHPAPEQTVQWHPARDTQYEARSVAPIGLYVLPR